MADLDLYFFGAVAIISATLSNVTKHEDTGIITQNKWGVHQTFKSDSGLTIGYRLVVDGKTVRNEPDIFAGKFWGSPTATNGKINELLKPTGAVKCTMKFNGSHWGILTKGLLSIDYDSCVPVTYTNAPKP
jgi:hypothetical protein